ncbi:arylamine N-acetyltransferase family protein [Streptomyces sp.]|uniref:arylamine N-acetyltransferase family protein n=1 Tax=Streptomyces sp. TaxID=1931 RepID=UPI002D312009|nr:arylamine N-acetyltransferase [Streptomyces sp.]HZF88406.1 arylamine N-acetyltransferase [Streptomyces sp.]
MSETTPLVDLDAYFRRIGWEGPRRADTATLRGLHLAHARSVPFENLEALRLRAPSLAPDDLMAKLVHSRRGGYCHEQNLLFSYVLEALGFRVTRLVARVVLGADRIESRPRGHMILLVTAADDPRPYLADVGYGAAGALLEAVPLVSGTELHDAGRRHRFVHAPHSGPSELWVLEAYDRVGDEWVAQYVFTLEPFELCDYEVLNWEVATNPRSPFTRRLFAQRTTSDGHLLLEGRLLTETGADGTVRKRELAGEAEVRQVLDADFGITVPDGMTLSL